MTTQDVRKIIAALEPLDQFASQTPVQRGWHAQWQTLFRQAVETVRGVAAAKPEPEPEDDASPGP